MQINLLVYFPIIGSFDIATSCLSLKGCKVIRITNLKISQILYSTGILIYLLKNIQNSGILSIRGDAELSWSDIRLECPSHSLLPVLDIRALPMFQPHHNFPKEVCLCNSWSLSNIAAIFPPE